MTSFLSNEASSSKAISTSLEFDTSFAARHSNTIAKSWLSFIKSLILWQVKRLHWYQDLDTIYKDLISSCCKSSPSVDPVNTDCLNNLDSSASSNIVLLVLILRYNVCSLKAMVSFDLSLPNSVLISSKYRSFKCGAIVWVSVQTGVANLRPKRYVTF